MNRGRGYSSRGSSYRGRGGTSWNSSSRGYSTSPRGGGSRFNSSSHNSSFSHNSSYDRKYSGSSDKYSSSRRDHHDEYRKPYKNDSTGYSSREHRSPERKRIRTESSHDRSFGGSGSGGEYKSRYDNERRSFSNDRRASSYKDEFRKPPPPSSPRGGYRGRVSSSRGGSLRARLRDRPVRKRLVESSYAVRRRVIPGRTSDFTRRLKISKLRSSIIRRPRRDIDERDSDTEADKKSLKDDSSPNVKKEKSDDEDERKSPKKIISPRKEENDNEEKNGSDSEDGKKSAFIKLTCPHCLIRFSTFGKYNLHLQSGRHAATMRRVATKQKTILSQMRLVQRKAQRELEKTTDDLAPRTSWCPMCKLNYKQPKATHQASSAHMEMKRFLMPHCKICKITFKSPMIYESHCCSIEHIKRKAALTVKTEKDETTTNEEELENFMTIDSIGECDEDGDPAEKKDGDKIKEQVNVGIEEIHKVEVYYCELCRMYLPRVSDDDEMSKELVRHCKQRTHLQKYIRFKEDKELVKKAERIVRKENAEKEREKESKEAESTVDDNPKGEKMDEALGDEFFDSYNALNNTGGVKRDDEDEDEDSIANGERYDRFKYSEKNLDEVKGVVVADEEEKLDANPEEDIKL